MILGILSFSVLTFTDFFKSKTKYGVYRLFLFFVSINLSKSGRKNNNVSEDDYYMCCFSFIIFVLLLLLCFVSLPPRLQPAEESSETNEF